MPRLLYWLFAGLNFYSTRLILDDVFLRIFFLTRRIVIREYDRGQRDMYTWLRQERRHVLRDVGCLKFLSDLAQCSCNLKEIHSLDMSKRTHQAFFKFVHCDATPAWTWNCLREAWRLSNESSKYLRCAAPFALSWHNYLPRTKRVSLFLNGIDPAETINLFADRQ